MECDSWTINNAKRWRIEAFELVLEKTLESPLDTKDIEPVSPKGSQLWLFFGRTGAETEASVLWLPDAKNQLIGKDPDAGKDWRQEEKGTTEYEMVGWLTDSMNVYLSKLWELVKDREAWHAAVHGVTKNRTWRSNGNERNWSEEGESQHKWSACVKFSDWLMVQ